MKLIKIQNNKWNKKYKKNKSFKLKKLILIILLFFSFYNVYFNQMIFDELKEGVSKNIFDKKLDKKKNLTEKLNNMLKLCNDLSSGELRKVMLLNGKNYINKCLSESENVKEYKRKIKPILSVVIPAFNCEKTINTTIKSIQYQNFTDYEIILINDFSKDNTSDIIHIKKKKDTRIKIINNKKNMGSLYSRCIGVLFSKGKYIFPLDNDDILFVEDIFDFILKIAINFDLDIVGFRAIKMENFRDDITKMKDLYNYNLLDNSIIHQPELSTWLISINGHFATHDVTIWCKCIKTKVYRDAVYKLGYDKYSLFVSWAEDTIINVILFNIAKSFLFIRKYGIVHWISTETASFVQSINVKLFGELILLEMIFKYSKGKDKNYAVECAYTIKRVFRIKSFSNNTNLIYFKSLIQMINKSSDITNENKKKIQKDFSFFLN